MRIRVRLDVQKSLKIEKMVKKANSEILVTFKYERLPSFCYVCGRIGNINRYCEVRFRIPKDRIVKLWDPTLRAPPRRRRPEPSSKYLVPSQAEVKKQEGSRRMGGGRERTPLALLHHNTPANIPALSVNFGASMEKQGTLDDYNWQGPKMWGGGGGGV
ncbi:hypothetical protein LINPERHAP1_LOCUS17386 [Linum perenne]